MYHYDQNGHEIPLHSTVFVDDPRPLPNHPWDNWNHAFAGQVEGFDEEMVVVVDGESNLFVVASHLIQVQD